MKLLKFSTVSVLIIITYFSLRTNSQQELPTNDKIGHFLAYATLSLHLLLVVHKRKRWYSAISFCIFYGILMELLQGLVPGRDSSLLDILANSCGVLIGCVIFWTVGNILIKTLQKINVISSTED